METNICTLCEENPAHELSSQGWCEECESSSVSCFVCDSTLDASEAESEGWTIENQAKVECERCRKAGEREEWIEETVEAVEQVATNHGWIVGEWHYAQTGSRYVTLTQDVDDPDVEAETLKVRVSDHSTCYCSEDVSLAMNPSGDDHTLRYLERRLSA